MGKILGGVDGHVSVVHTDLVCMIYGWEIHNGTLEKKLILR
jgi:hypothetical protein